MTPLDKAADILAEVQAFALARGVELPAEKSQYPMVGNNVIACEGVTVNVVSANMLPLNNLNSFTASQLAVTECGPAQIGIFTIVISRECAALFNDDGTDNPENVAAVSALMDADGQLLWDWAVDYDAWIQKDWSIGFSVEGALAITSLQMTTGVD